MFERDRETPTPFYYQHPTTKCRITALGPKQEAVTCFRLLHEGEETRYNYCVLSYY